MNATRVLILLLPLFAVLGCRSRGEPQAPSKPAPKHDYGSINASSLEFLRETFDESRAMSRRELREWSTGSRARREKNKLSTRRSLSFLGESLTTLERGNTRAMGSNVADEFAGRNVPDFWASVRFGFLDSGE